MRSDPRERLAAKILGNLAYELTQRSRLKHNPEKWKLIFGKILTLFGLSR